MNPATGVAIAWEVCNTERMTTTTPKHVYRPALPSLREIAAGACPWEAPETCAACGNAPEHANHTPVRRADGNLR